MKLIVDPAHFYTVPAFSWQALLKTASKYCEHEKKRKDQESCLDEFRIELLRDIDMLLIFEKGIRGGITEAVKRYAEANNKYMKDVYNPDEKSTYLQYLEAKQSLRMGNDPKTPNTWVFMGESRRFYHRKNG